MQPVLSNLVAGIQIAITQPVRIEDAVIVENEWGWLEEINSTYVVIRLWDWRRLVLPLTYCIWKPFQNWAREGASLIGSIFLRVDHRAPVEAMRTKLSEIAAQSRLWDRNVVNLQVSDAKESVIEIRMLVSACDAPQDWDLRSEVREKTIVFLQTEHPRVLPRQRAEWMQAEAPPSPGRNRRGRAARRNLPPGNFTRSPVVWLAAAVRLPHKASGRPEPRGRILTVTQLTHHDLDGYGASTIVGAFLDVSRIVHIPRYADVGPVVDAELKRLSRTPAPECLIMTDLGLEAVAVTFITRFTAMNLRRDEAVRHRLIVLDHHASSLDQLREQGLTLVPVPERPGLTRVELTDPNVVVLIDEDRCATRLAYEHRELYASREVEGETTEELETLVAAVDALDLWKKERPTFRGGLALDEIFWDNVATLIPVGHPWHDRFISALLRAVSAVLREGASPARVEAEIAATRRRLVDALLADEPQDDPTLTTRMRMARALARSDALFQRLSDGTLLSFGLDSGMFQRVSDLVMEGGRATRVVNVQRTGSLSFRSNNETALDGARKFRGGGHKDAAGGKLNAGSAFSLADAVAQVEPVLNPPQPDPASSPFAALKAWKG